MAVGLRSRRAGGARPAADESIWQKHARTTPPMACTLLTLPSVPPILELRRWPSEISRMIKIVPRRGNQFDWRRGSFTPSFARQNAWGQTQLSSAAGRPEATRRSNHVGRCWLARLPGQRILYHLLGWSCLEPSQESHHPEECCAICLAQHLVASRSPRESATRPVP